MYQLMKNPQGVVCAVNENVNGVEYSIPFAVDNSDYVQFKKAVLNGAELQDAEGNTMSAEQATQFVKELP
jgi:hypothetical protein